MKRRDFIRLTAAGSALLGGGGLLLGCGENPDVGGSGAQVDPMEALFGSGPMDPLKVAESAAAWLRYHTVDVRSGYTWPMVPGESEAASVNLYSGTPGIILFLLELHHATENPLYLQAARDGAFILQGAFTEDGGWPAAAGISPQDPTLFDPGLYTGMAGAAFTLLEVHKATGDPVVLSGAMELLSRVLNSAQSVGPGMAWFLEDPATASYDIISGSAGIGLTLLYAHEILEEPGLLDTADGAGAFLLSKGRPAGGGVKWPMSEVYPRLMPNFSHGTAGVAYYLARLARATENQAYLDAAIQGARYLQANSNCAESGCRIFHHEPEGEDLFYLGWCHGPPGTARLFYELTRATGDPSWMEWIVSSAEGIRARGVPETRPEGLWNNVSQCCGDAGIGDFFLALAGMDAGEGYAAFARQLGQHILGKGRMREAGAEEGPRGDGGLHWLQAEHRSQPDFIQAQTGWMQGAAGIGAFFLHLDGLAKGRKARITFPDSPWGGLI